MSALKSLVAGVLLAILPCMGASAQIIQEIDTRVVLMHDGSALVEQRWDVIIDEDDSGTEWYIPVNDMSRLGMDIKGLSVSENGTVFTSEGDGWVSKGRSRSDKANRCGILRYKDGSFDLCWGFGTTGQHQWDISYTITNLVQSLNDGNDAFIHQFVNDQLPSTPYHVRITVCAADSSITWNPTENVGGWTFGYECNNEFVGNSFVSDSDGRVRSAIVMMRFDKGMFSPSRSRNISFEQMQKKAFKGSDYKKKSGSGFSLGDLWDIFVEFGWLIISVFAIVGFWIYSTIRRKYIKATGKRWKQDIFGESRIDGWWREAPMGKDLDAAYALLKKGDKLAGDEKYDNGIVGAYFLRWIEEGVMKVTEETGENNKKRVNLLLTDIEPSGDATPERKLYEMVVKAAGENRILERNEFQKWSKANYTTVNAWPGKALSAGTSAWKTASMDDRKHLVQFKTFLQDFTLMEEREAGQVMLWKDYLVYAQLFGIADKVARNFQKLYPAEFKELTESMGVSSYGLMHTMNTASSYANLMMYTAQTRQREVDAASYRSSGGGGRGSFGGGGGFSGGGHGGGTR